MMVLVCGDRNWTDKERVKKRLAELRPDTIIIHGAARGADRLADEAAKELGYFVKKFPAEWAKYGRYAGFKRNLEMLDMSPKLVIAFHSDLTKSKGTAHTVKNARKLGIEVEVIAA